MKSLKDILPWEDRPEGCKDVMWRYSKNPIIDRYHIPTSNSIFNSAVVPFEDGFAGVFRCDNKAVQMNIFVGFSKDGLNWDISHEPIKFEAGTPNIEGVIGLGAAVEYLMSIGMENISAYEKELRAYFAEKLKGLDNIEFYNPNNTSGPITFNAKGVFAQDAAGYLGASHIAVRSGNHCAKVLHEVIGTDQTIRASLYFYNTKEEVDRFIEVAKNISLENAVGIFF